MNFEEWFETTISEYTCEFGSEGIRDIYTLPCNIKIYDEVFLPRSIFQSQSTQTLVDYIVHRSQEKILEKYGSIIDYDRYIEDNYGYPLFYGEDCTEKAFNFAMNIKGILNAV